MKACYIYRGMTVHGFLYLISTMSWIIFLNAAIHSMIVSAIMK